LKTWFIVDLLATIPTELILAGAKSIGLEENI
jgi:hypothetical protein